MNSIKLRLSILHSDDLIGTLYLIVILTVKITTMKSIVIFISSFYK